MCVEGGGGGVKKAIHKFIDFSDIVCLTDLNWHGFLRFYCSVFSLILVSIENIYKTLRTVFDKRVITWFDRIAKLSDVRQKSSAARRIDSLLSV